MIKKPCIIITSGGRTGTEFYSRVLPTFIKESVAYHEPERITRFYSFKEIKNTFSKFGVINSTFRKIDKYWGLRPLSHQRMRGEVDREKATKRILELRKNFVEKQSEEIYIESSYHYYGLIDLLPWVFENHRLAYIIRDGRDWVRSHMNTTKWYSKKHLPSRLSMMLRPERSDEYYDTWATMDEFSKLCWLWQKISNYADKTLLENKSAKMFYFEDLFLSDKKREEQLELLDFITSVDVGLKYQFDESGLNKKINKTTINRFPKWDDWSRKQKNTFKDICGVTMSKFDYKI